MLFCNDMDPDYAASFLAKLDQDNWPMAATYWADWHYGDLSDAPSSYIICERDGILPPAWQHLFADRLSVQRRVSIDAGHQAMNTQPERLAELLMAQASH